MADFDVACGVVVVVVVVGVVVGVSPDDGSPLDAVVVVVEVDGVASLLEAWVAVVVVLSAELVVPGCSFATTTPMIAVDAVAAITADWVMRRRRTLARLRASGVMCSFERFTVASFSGCFHGITLACPQTKSLL